MKRYYLDTNIFLYLADSSSPQQKACEDFVYSVSSANDRLITSTETIQEIIHRAVCMKQKENGIVIAQNVINLVDELTSVDETVIQSYITLTQSHVFQQSRDILHLASAIVSRADYIVTYDKDFLKFKEIEIIKPDWLKK